MQNSVWDIRTTESDVQEFFIPYDSLAMIIIYLLIIERINTYSTTYGTVMVLGFKLYGSKISFKGFLYFTETNRSEE